VLLVELLTAARQQLGELEPQIKPAKIEHAQRVVARPNAWTEHDFSSYFRPCRHAYTYRTPVHFFPQPGKPLAAHFDELARYPQPEGHEYDGALCPVCLIGAIREHKALLVNPGAVLESIGVSFTGLVAEVARRFGTPTEKEIDQAHDLWHDEVFGASVG
jgi:hypothetical protein